MPHVAFRPNEATAPVDRTWSSLVLVVVAGLGFCATVAQLALVRELLGAFSGNELTFGIALASWLGLTAIGTWLGSRVHRGLRPLRLLAIGLAIVSLLPIAEVLAIRGLRAVVFPRGIAVDPIATALACLVALGPFCIGSGAGLIYGCRILGRPTNSPSTGRIYVADATGSIAGATVFTFGFAPRLDHVAILCCSSAVMFGIAATVCWRRRGRLLAIGSGTAAALAVATAAIGHLDAVSTAWQFRGSEVVWRASSPYGRLVVTRGWGQLTFFENGVPVAFTANAVATEEIAHYAMAQRPAAKSVLLIGGGVAGVAREVLRYPAIRDVTCVELDPEMVAAGRQLLAPNLSDPRIHVVVADGRRYVQRTAERFDAILIALPDPTTFQLNRFFTAEFFATAKRILAPGGVIAFGIGHYENYVSGDLAQLLASSRQTLAEAFTHVVAIPGGRVFFLGSNLPLHRDIAAALERAGIAPRLVNRNYLDATLTPDRLADIDAAIAIPARTNRDFRPVLYLLRLQQWESQFAFPAGGFAVALVIALGTCLLRFPPVPRMVFASGFAASALEVAALVAFQVFYGAMYQQIGLVVAVFMLGLAAGSALGVRASVTSPRQAVRWLALGVAVLAATFAVALPEIGGLDQLTGSTVGGQLAVLTLTLSLAGVVGAQFAIASAETSPRDPQAAPRLFSADLVGAALGAIAVSSFMLPAWGLTTVCLATAGLNLVAAALASPAQRCP